jgi:hypothetical protein
MPRQVLPKGNDKKAVGPGHRVTGEGLDPRAVNQLRNMFVSSIIDGMVGSGNMASTSSARSALARRLGYEYQGDRDVYTALGYTKELEFKDYMGKYQRGDMARRIVKEPVQATWRSVPEVIETLPERRPLDGEKTPFEVAFEALSFRKDLKLWHNVRKADLVSGIGRWGVLFLGLSDVETREDFAKPAEKGSELLYLTPLNENQARVSSTVTDPTDPRFGEPEFYELIFETTGQKTVEGTRADVPRAQGDAGSSQSTRVHWSRVVHLAEESDESGVVGTPRLQAVYNRLVDLDRVVGSTGEAFWRNAFPLMQFKLDPAFQFQDEKQDLSELKTEIEGLVHRWERYIRTKGVDIETLENSIATPKESFEVIVSVISSTTNIPQRILLGSERGELASSQDKDQYAVVIQERRTQYVEPVVLDELIGRFVALDILPEPASWSYVWPSVFTPSEKDRAEVSKANTEMLTKYADSIGASSIVPLAFFLRSEKFLSLSEDEAMKVEEMIEQAGKEAQGAIEDENNQIEQEMEEEDAEQDE